MRIFGGNKYLMLGNIFLENKCLFLTLNPFFNKVIICKHTRNSRSFSYDLTLKYGKTLPPLVKLHTLLCAIFLNSYLSNM